MKTHALTLLVVVALVGCTPPSIDDVLWRCTTNADCGDRLVCDPILSACVPSGSLSEGEGEGEGEGEEVKGTGTRTDPFVLSVDDELAIHTVAGLASEVCYAVSTTTTTRLEVQTSGLCADGDASDTIVDVLNADFSVLVTNDDGDNIGRCSLVTTPELPPGTTVFCVYGYDQGAVDATVTVRVGERFAAIGGPCESASVLRGCDPVPVDYNTDSVTDLLECVSAQCEPVYRVANDSPCTVDIDVCEVGDCLLFSDSGQTRCGVPDLLEEGAACEFGLTGTICGGGTRCRPDPSGTSCQDCVINVVGALLMLCGVARTYAEATALCIENGMKMVSIVDREKDYDVYYRALDDFGYKGLYWIGLNDIDAEGLYTWVDGRTWEFGAPEPYAGWADNEPTRADDQDCIGTDDEGYWADEACDAGRATICED